MTVVFIEHGLLVLKIYLEEVIDDYPQKILEGDRENDQLIEEFQKSQDKTKDSKQKNRSSITQ